MSRTSDVLRKAVIVALPLLVLAGGFAMSKYIKANPPEARKRPSQRAAVVPVDAIRLSQQDYRVKLRSYGSVQPRKQTALVAQVSGVVAEVSPNFRVGAAFEKGDVLITLDSRDYVLAKRSAQANLIQARALYKEEVARGDQAAEDWVQLGKQGRPGALLLRTPQRQAADAQVQAAKAQVDRAQLDLERTKIRAPYAGQVLSTSVNEGRFVLSRSEGTVDPATRQVFVVAELEDTEGLSVGQFVEASISGTLFNDVFVIPERVLRPDGKVFLLIDGEALLAPVELLHSDGEQAVVGGLIAGDVLITTPLGNAVDGMRVKASIAGEQSLLPGTDDQRGNTSTSREGVDGEVLRRPNGSESKRKDQRERRLKNTPAGE